MGSVRVVYAESTNSKQQAVVPRPNPNSGVSFFDDYGPSKTQKFRTHGLGTLKRRLSIFGAFGPSRAVEFH